MQYAVPGDEYFARLRLRVLAGFRKGQGRRDAGVAAGEDRLPFGARARTKALSESRLKDRPAISVVLRGEAGRIELQQAEEDGVKPSFNCAHSHPATVAGHVAAVIRCAAVQHVLSARTLQACLSQAVEHGQKAVDSIDHRCVDRLASAGPLRLDDSADDTEGHVHSAAAIVAQEV